jgi:phosphoglycerol geranylgeranyltransferase
MKETSSFQKNSDSVSKFYSMNIYNQILQARANKQKLLAVLIDPDKVTENSLSISCEKINTSPATHILIGGSQVTQNNLDEIILILKKQTKLPILLFPGNPSQISGKADGILFLSLLSGRNPDYLIEHQVNAVPKLQKTTLEIIATGYILIESGNETAVARVSKTKPLDRDDSNYVVQTALAGQFLGSQLIYLEAGSGAKLSVPLQMIEKVSKNCSVPLIVGGGIQTKTQIESAYRAGADLVVIGTAFENDPNFFDF